MKSGCYSGARCPEIERNATNVLLGIRGNERKLLTEMNLSSRLENYFEVKVKARWNTDMPCMLEGYVYIYVPRKTLKCSNFWTGDPRQGKMWSHGVMQKIITVMDSLLFKIQKSIMR